jgi:type VI secretion system protein VasG
MAEIKRAILFGKLNRFAYKAMEEATIFCKMRGNPYVELVHGIFQILRTGDSDLQRIVAQYNLDSSRVASDLVAVLDSLPRGATSITDFSPHLEEAVERGWLYASLFYGDTAVRTGHLVVALLITPGLRNVFLGLSPEFAKINPDDLAANFAKIVEGSGEGGGPTAGPAAGGGEAIPGIASGAMPPAAMGKQEGLARFSVDLTEKARRGEIDPVVGRDFEIRQIVDVLMRRRQNNPILTGEAGVGKTAVVEGFAARIAQGDVPPALKEVSVRSLDLGLLQAGASMKGEFEARLRQVIDEVQASSKPIILFIDEAHTLIGAGGAAGQGDAANLLKPALARGTLRTIAATTWAEYKRYFEKDPALTRRFQVIKVEEPSEEKAVQMVRGVSTVLEKHHGVHLRDEALVAAVSLSHRYIPSRQLPDKAVSLIDTVCARVAISQHATPPPLEDAVRRVQALEVEREILERESAVGADHAARQAKLNAELDEARKSEADLRKAYTAELEKAQELLALRTRLREGGENREASLAQLATVERQLKEMQGESPLVITEVDEQSVAGVVADWTGIPVGRMVKDEIQAVLHLADHLEKRVIGQRHGLDAIARRLQTSRAGLVDPNKPIGVFLLAGPSGVGKTETALALAETLYGGEGSLITINMSEFQEAHTVSTLKGAPPGYVGYGEGGVLTEAVRRRPYSVVLLDEVEKAHPDVHEIFFQVFDKGRMEDGEGRLIDFKNTVILLTSNVGTDLIMSMCKDPELRPTPDALVAPLREPLLKVFPPALLGRLVVIPYVPLSDEMLRAIIRLQLQRIQRRMQENQEIALSYGDAVVDLIASRCTEVESGGRMVDAILTQNVLPELSRGLLNRMLERVPVTKVQIDVADGDFKFAFTA